MRIAPWALWTMAGAALIGMACNRAPAQPAGGAAAIPVTRFGDMKPIVSVKELMQFMIDPVSDNIFDAVWTDIRPGGNVEHMPKTDEDWDRVKTGAVSLAEGIYLLKIPRPFTPPGDVNNSTGPNPPELSPKQIQELVDKDPVVWQAKIEALRNVALEVIEVVKKRNVEELFAASEDLDEACEACHLTYWYPGDRQAVDEDKKQRAGYIKPGLRAVPAPEKK